ncbi:MAG: hypothetical protein IKR85_03470 [Clostridia bacterium]|nr:hypothetical protein [Clostridia bacterium]
MGTLAVLHTTPSTISSISEICQNLLPGVRVDNYLDESVLRQINAEGEISCGARYRFYEIVSLAAAAKPDAILCACSSVGGMLEEARSFVSVPLFRIDEPMARAAAERRGRTVVCATLASTLNPTLEIIARYAPDAQKPEALFISEAARYMSADRERYLSTIASALEDAVLKFDTVVLAQASMAQAAQRLPLTLREKLLTSPESGVAQLKEVFGV